METEAAEAQAARNRPPPVPQLGTQAEQMEFIISSVQGMEKNIQEILENQKSLERVLDPKFHDTDVKSSDLATTPNFLELEEMNRKLKVSEEELDRINKRFEDGQTVAADMDWLKAELAQGKQEATEQR
ncbi:hypothetical protein D1007_03447 [Hordeum vulgare]|nr:hypothetical protein D1007_03447 [Hordeum vulgare]